MKVTKWSCGNKTIISKTVKLYRIVIICEIRFSDHSLVEPFIKHHAIRSEFTSLDNTLTFYRIVHKELKFSYKCYVVSEYALN
ncbi:LOW QUALITY PROTEIN: hypothetical protein V1478_006079 [Vespula squamosa]|uniref:Uncharacterized protein n=1 Tax=Vespula squamosa TaxID=30214 RepID=A0ABD2B6V8_VESSQ